MDDRNWPTSETADEGLAALARRATRLDHTLRTMEALEAFRTEAAALRAELRELREAQAAVARQPKPPRVSHVALPDGFARFLAEAGFLIGVAVIVSLAQLSRPAILGVMGGAWLVTALAEALWTRGFDAPWSRPTYWPLPPAQPANNGTGAAPIEHTVVENTGAADASPAPEPRPAQTFTPRLPGRRRSKQDKVPA